MVKLRNLNWKEFWKATGFEHNEGWSQRKVMQEAGRKPLKEEKDELDNDDVENEKEGIRIVGILKQSGTLSEVDKWSWRSIWESLAASPTYYYSLDLS